ncbi:MAG: cytidylate kinase-like family protein [Lachnospiraceae bacterium]|nr:cytidylate kinase-like family protein [Lachnospiraceae bacterium]
MEEQVIIAIGREFGSGGHEIGKELAERFRLSFYDRNLLDHMFIGAEDLKEMMRGFEEKLSHPLFSRRVRGHSNSIAENLAQMQFQFIREKAEQGESFVIIGRCAETILKENPNLITIFILGDQESKMERVKRIYELPKQDAISKMMRHDEQRKKYHNRYSLFKWGDSRGYDLCINSSKLGIEGTVDVLENYIKRRIQE